MQIYDNFLYLSFFSVIIYTILSYLFYIILSYLFYIKEAPRTTPSYSIVYHHYSVPTILQVVTRICFWKKLFYYRFAEDKLHSAIWKPAFIALVCIIF